MKINSRVILILAIIISIVSCKKKLGEGDPVIPPLDPVNHRNRISLFTKEVAEVLQQVYQNMAAFREVNAAIHSGYYEDERVLLKDLLFPSSSELYSKEPFRKMRVDTGVFRRVFCSIVEKGNYPLLSGELNYASWNRVRPVPAVISNDAQIINDNSTGIVSGAQPIAIYFPYSENFPDSAVPLPANIKLAIIRMPTIVYTDRESESAPGQAPYYCSGSPGYVCYRTVTVDDNYAVARPTHIVTIGAVIKQPDLTEIPKSILVTRTYHGSSKLTRQMDKLISFTGNGGGSEIKVCRINGYLKKSDEQINDFAGDVVTLHYTRGDIRNNKWKRVFSVWDPNWNYQDIEQIYAVYEDDNKGTRTIDGTLKTTLTLPAKLGKGEGNLGFRIDIMSQDEIITQRKLDRKSYLRDGLNNQGWGYLPDAADFLSAGQDWPVFDGGSIWQYTLPYRIY